MDAQIITRPEFSVVGIENPHMPWGGNQQLMFQVWNDFMTRHATIPHRAHERGTYGVCLPGGQGTFIYMAAAEVTSLTDVPEGMVARTIPAARYAVFTHHGPAETIRQTFGQIYTQGLPEASCERADPSVPDLEIYAPGYDPDVPDGTMEIAIPIK